MPLTNQARPKSATLTTRTKPAGKGGLPLLSGCVAIQVGVIRLLRRLKDRPAARLLIERGTEAHAAAVPAVVSQPGLAGHVYIEDVVMTGGG